MNVSSEQVCLLSVGFLAMGVIFHFLVCKFGMPDPEGRQRLLPFFTNQIKTGADKKYFLGPMYLGRVWEKDSKMTLINKFFHIIVL